MEKRLEQNVEEIKKVSRTKLANATLTVAFSVVILLAVSAIVYGFMVMSGARKETDKTERSTDTVTGYYAADLEAEEILADLRNGLTPVSATIYKAEKSKGGVKRILADGVGYTDWDAYATYHCDIDKEHVIRVEVLLRFNKKKEYQILKWSKEYTGEWKKEDGEKMKTMNKLEGSSNDSIK